MIDLEKHDGRAMPKLAARQMASMRRLCSMYLINQS